MEPFATVTSLAASLPMINIDTDMIIPKQYLKTIKRTGLGVGLFSELRYDEDGKPRADFVLNQPPYDQAEILIAGENFGCGSSREHAPWALKDFGIRCIIASSFADIFYNNCFQNSVLPIKIPEEQVKELHRLSSQGSNATFTVDLEKQVIVTPEGEISFDLDPHKRHCLLNGLDTIGLTMQNESSIDSFEQKDKESRPWI